jgi:hypothetical protein
MRTGKTLMIGKTKELLRLFLRLSAVNDLAFSRSGSSVLISGKSFLMLFSAPPA